MMSNLKDPAWRLNNLYKIIDKNGKRIRFGQNEVQQKINEDPALRKMILKARQLGVSTNEIISILDFTIWTPDTTTCILAHEQDSIKKLFRVARRAYDFMPEELKPEIDRGGGSMYEMFFPEINSRIYCDLESRGDTIQRLLVSELAFFRDPERLKATLQSVPLNGRVTLETTPNGLGNFFYDMWTDPLQPYSKLFFPWYIFKLYAIPVHGDIGPLSDEEISLCEKAFSLYGVQLTKEQIAFRRLKKAELGANFIQEYPEDDQTCFLSSGEASMDLVKVKDAMVKAIKPISDDGCVKIFKKYEKGRTYVCGADTAEGVKGDYSAGVILDAASREQVATIRGRIKPYDFAHALNKLCLSYKSPKDMPPMLAVERNNHGHAVILELQEHIGYPNLFRHMDERTGWRTDSVTRPIMIDSFIESLENRSIIINDLDILGECLTLVTSGGKIQAAEGKHDDLVIATSIALQMVIKVASLEVYKNIRTMIRV